MKFPHATARRGRFAPEAPASAGAPKGTRIAYPLVAAALAGSMLPLTGAAAAGAGGPAAAFSGFSSTGIATPVKIEIFEPTIPIPTAPQGELDLGYTKIKADSSSTKGRASFMWPGDAVGEGFKTFVEQLGLPSELGQNGYPVQVLSLIHI